MVKVALWVRLEAKPGKEADVEHFLRGGLPLVQAEPGTMAWFGVRLSPSTFGIFDAFPDDAGRNAHLSGRVAAALTEKASELFAQPPTIETDHGTASPSNAQRAVIASDAELFGLVTQTELFPSHRFNPNGTVRYSITNGGSGCTTSYSFERGLQDDFVRTFERQR